MLKTKLSTMAAFAGAALALAGIGAPSASRASPARRKSPKESAQARRKCPKESAQALQAAEAKRARRAARNLRNATGDLGLKNAT
jgi:hypothetical protein